MMNWRQWAKPGRLAFCLILVTIGEGCKDAPNIERLATGQLNFERSQIVVQVEIADTEKKRAQGLMHRQELADDAGMLFVFAGEAIRGVWMKNTHIPLDILFLSAKGEIVSWLQHVSPCVADDCEVYHSAVPAGYMLEVNAGFIAHWSIRLGDKVSVFIQR